VKPLNRFQQRVYDCLRSKFQANGFAPSIREIGAELGLSSSSTVHRHLCSLEHKGYIRRNPSKPRSIGLIDRPMPTSEKATLVMLVGELMQALAEVAPDHHLLARSEQIVASLS